MLGAIALNAMFYSGSGMASNSIKESIPETVQVVEAARASVVAAARNLNGMRGSLQSSEEDAAQKVISEAWLVFATAGGIVTTGDIYEKMKSKDDKTLVLQYVRASAKRYLTQVDISLPWLNECLVRIRTPAALVEATKVRDKMIEARMAAELFENIGS